MTPVRAVLLFLLVVHGLLAAWAIVGFVEWFWAAPPWPRVSNELFPRDVLFVQWASTLAASAVFLLGYALGWRHTPIAMACAYAAMAAVCAVETFGYMESDSRFVAMGAEYVAYAAILVFLFLFRARLYRASR